MVVDEVQSFLLLYPFTIDYYFLFSCMISTPIVLVEGFMGNNFLILIFRCNFRALHGVRIYEPMRQLICLMETLSRTDWFHFGLLREVLWQYFCYISKTIQQVR